MQRIYCCSCWTLLDYDFHVFFVSWVGLLGFGLVSSCHLLLVEAAKRQLRHFGTSSFLGLVDSMAMLLAS